MNYFITGGSGLIGAYVTRQLVDAGHRVIIFDITPDLSFLESILSPEQMTGVELVAGDVTDRLAILRALKASASQRIIHLAALLSSRSNDNPTLSLKVNCEGTLNIFEAAMDRGVERTVWASSVGVFGLASRHPVRPMPNDIAHQPTDLYGACKSLNERFSKHYRRAYGLDCIGLRYSVVFGYGKARTLSRGTGADFLAELIDKPAAGQPGRIPAGDAILDMVHVEDAARATILACEPRGGQPIAVNVGGFRTSLRDAAAIVREILPAAELTVEEGSWNGIDHHYDLTAAEAAIGYAPLIGLREGLRENIEQVQRRLPAHWEN